MTIHKEGRKLLIALFVLLVAINLLLIDILTVPGYVRQIVGLASVIVYLLVLQFFRSPKVLINPDERYVLAPADGKVVVIEDTEEQEYFREKRKQISIFMSPTNVHVNRSPVTGLIKFFKYHAGRYLVAWHPKSSTDNERTTIVVETGKGVEVLFRQIAGAMARRIKWYVHEGDMIEQGAEFGFIKFGSRVDIFLPLDAEVKVSIGDKTKGGHTVIAELS